MQVAVGEKIVTSQNYLATHVGAKVLEDGGNAFDATIAVSAVLSVVLPHTSGLGGDGFLFALTPEGIIAFNSSGWSPKNLKKEKIGERDPNSIVVPGLVDAWNFIYNEYATMDLSRLLSPAIALSTNGFYLGKSLYKSILSSSGLGDTWKKTFGDKTFGSKLKLPRLGNALKIISRDPRDFYQGKLAEEIVIGLRSNGSTMEISDFSEFHGEKVKMIRTTYRDFNVYEFPPNSQGITTLEILKMSEIKELWKRPYTDYERVNDYIKILSIAYADRDNYVADPRFYQIPDLLDEIRLKNALKGKAKTNILSDGDTTFFAISDGENLVGFIQSLFYPFGSGIVVNDIVFNNRGFGFTTGHNQPEGRKRPMHTLSILYAEREGEELLIGCAGGDLRPQIHSQVFQYYTDYGMEIDEAVHSPRLIMTGDKIMVEKRLEIPFPKLDFMVPDVGIVQAIKRKGSYTIGVADPRSEGVALPV
ncbi:gamma-glutamyltransferase [Candidatus Acidianus copahuensis]|uniref:Gamma-glutamyltransferase n=1 Tax=Candidatus Acidianus copahuensis TaxID=1160895 RepID=A0A031LUG3_9CREN|nr:gamma-glutamyltransferase family protein [Candidatus Acidianus copahuensis]EZQ11084.1 gamma-glutamyltransferase [Candidatus Acidianus copahuensis]